jgi:transcriptional regulator with XRE-family HTH domain
VGVNFGAALKAAREEAGILQAVLAEKADLDPSYISLLENNRKSPTLTVYFRLCEVLGTRPSALMKRVEEMPPPAAKRLRDRKRPPR